MPEFKDVRTLQRTAEEMMRVRSTKAASQAPLSLFLFLRMSLPFFASLMMHWFSSLHLASSCSGEASGHHFTLPLAKPDCGSNLSSQSCRRANWSGPRLRDVRVTSALVCLLQFA